MTKYTHVLLAGASATCALMLGLSQPGPMIR